MIAAWMPPALLSCALLSALGAGWRAWAVGRKVLGVAGVALVLSGVSFGTFARIPPWLAALSLVHAVATLCKLLALSRPTAGPVSVARGLAYLALYPALEPSLAFVPDPAAARGAGVRALGVGLVEMCAGFAFAAFAAARGWLDAGLYPATWARAVSFVLLIDGGFRAAAGLQRSLGWHAEDLFREPWAMSDLADFWGRRWNRFIARSLAVEVYAPVLRRAGRVAAVFAVFLVSGVFHEAILRLSTGRAEDGRYTTFFLLQALAIVASRALPRSGRVAGPAQRAFGWAFLLATAPLFLAGPFPTAAPMEALLRGWF